MGRLLVGTIPRLLALLVCLASWSAYDLTVDILSPFGEAKANITRTTQQVNSGTETPSGRMVFRKWNKIYARAALTQGIEFLLVEKIYRHDANGTGWTVVDPVHRVQVINVRDRNIFTARINGAS